MSAHDQLGTQLYTSALAAGLTNITSAVTTALSVRPGHRSSVTSSKVTARGTDSQLRQLSAALQLQFTGKLLSLRETDDCPQFSLMAVAGCQLRICAWDREDEKAYVVLFWAQRDRPCWKVLRRLEEAYQEVPELSAAVETIAIHQDGDRDSAAHFFAKMGWTRLGNYVGANAAQHADLLELFSVKHPVCFIVHRGKIAWKGDPSHRHVAKRIEQFLANKSFPTLKSTVKVSTRLERVYSEDELPGIISTVEDNMTQLAAISELSAPEFVYTVVTKRSEERVVRSAESRLSGQFLSVHREEVEAAIKPIQALFPAVRLALGFINPLVAVKSRREECAVCSTQLTEIDTNYIRPNCDPADLRYTVKRGQALRDSAVYEIIPEAATVSPSHQLQDYKSIYRCMECSRLTLCVACEEQIWNSSAVLQSTGHLASHNILKIPLIISKPTTLGAEETAQYLYSLCCGIGLQEVAVKSTHTLQVTSGSTDMRSSKAHVIACFGTKEQEQAIASAAGGQFGSLLINRSRSEPGSDLPSLTLLKLASTEEHTFQWKKTDPKVYLLDFIHKQSRKLRLRMYRKLLSRNCHWSAAVQVLPVILDSSLRKAELKVSRLHEDIACYWQVTSTSFPGLSEKGPECMVIYRGTVVRRYHGEARELEGDIDSLLTHGVTVQTAEAEHRLEAEMWAAVSTAAGLVQQFGAATAHRMTLSYKLKVKRRGYSVVRCGSARLAGSFPQQLKNAAESTAHRIQTLFPYVVCDFHYFDVLPTIIRGSECSLCQKPLTLTDVQYLCPYCEPRHCHCEQCEQTAAHVHKVYKLTAASAHYSELRFGANLPMEGPEGMRTGIINCSGCGEVISQTWFKCAHCQSFHYCEMCEEAARRGHLEGKKSHARDHVMLKIPHCAK